jgi:hypothetical protein
VCLTGKDHFIEFNFVACSIVSVTSPQKSSLHKYTLKSKYNLAGHKRILRKKITSRFMYVKTAQFACGIKCGGINSSPYKATESLTGECELS